MLPETSLAFQMQGAYRKNKEGRHRDALHFAERIAHIFKIVGHVYALFAHFDPFEPHQGKGQKKCTGQKYEQHDTPDDQGRGVAHSRKFYN